MIEKTSYKRSTLMLNPNMQKFSRFRTKAFAKERPNDRSPLIGNLGLLSIPGCLWPLACATGMMQRIASRLRLHNLLRTVGRRQTIDRPHPDIHRVHDIAVRVHGCIKAIADCSLTHNGSVHLTIVATFWWAVHSVLKVQDCFNVSKAFRVHQETKWHLLDLDSPTILRCSVSCMSPASRRLPQSFSYWNIWPTLCRHVGGSDHHQGQTFTTGSGMSKSTHPTGPGMLHIPSSPLQRYVVRFHACCNL